MLHISLMLHISSSAQTKSMTSRSFFGHMIMVPLEIPFPWTVLLKFHTHIWHLS